METTTRPPQLVTIRGTQQQVPVSRAYIYELFERGELQRAKIGRRSFVTQSSIDEFIDRLSGGEA